MALSMKVHIESYWNRLPGLSSTGLASQSFTQSVLLLRMVQSGFTPEAIISRSRTVMAAMLSLTRPVRLSGKKVITLSSRRSRLSSMAQPTASEVNVLLAEYSVWLSSARKGAGCNSATTLPWRTTITWWMSHSGRPISESIMLMTAWVLIPSAAGVLRGKSPTCAASSSGNNASNTNN